jgi:flavin reductase (DIM6/NTAB) family NADH-FMN oxidoreductase RutF
MENLLPMIQFEALFRVSYGLYIVSSGDDKIRNGFISNTVFQVTAEPPKFAVCCNKDNYTAEIIKKTGAFTVSVLKKDVDTKLIGRFGYQSGKNTDKFKGTDFITRKTGAPIVMNDSIAWLECNVKDTFDVGTHLLFIGELVNSEIIDENAEPVTYEYYRRVKKGIAPRNAPTYIDKSKLEGIRSMSGNNRYRCPECGYIYDPVKGDPDSGIEPGTPFEDLPEEWVCPVCGTVKVDFIKLDN